MLYKICPRVAKNTYPYSNNDNNNNNNNNNSNFLRVNNRYY